MHRFIAFLWTIPFLPHGDNAQGLVGTITPQLAEQSNSHLDTSAQGPDSGRDTSLDVTPCAERPIAQWVVDSDGTPPCADSPLEIQGRRGLFALTRQRNVNPITLFLRPSLPFTSHPGFTPRPIFITGLAPGVVLA